MPIMGVCDECGMLMQLLPDGSCPNGHGRSSIRDTFETRAPSVNHAAFADEEGGPPAAPPEQPVQEARAAEPDDAQYSSDSPEEDPVVYASEVPEVTQTPASTADSTLKARRAIITIVVAFFLLQALCGCGGAVINMVRSLL